MKGQHPKEIEAAHSLGHKETLYYMKSYHRDWLNEYEAELLAEWSQKSNGFSKAFRMSWAGKTIVERVLMLESLIREAKMEAF